MKKWFPVCLCLLLLLTACGKKAEFAPTLEEDDPVIPSAGVANPWTDHDTLADAEKAVGFALSAPDEIAGYDAPIYRTLSGTLLEILYPGESGEIRIRKQAATDAVGNDISGDWNEYSEHTAITTAGEDAAITLDGSGGCVSRAIWTVNGYAYSITVEPAMDVLTIADLTAQVN